MFLKEFSLVCFVCFFSLVRAQVSRQESTDPYEVFKISNNSTTEEIKKRYRALSKRYHPDSNSPSASTSQFQKIQHAYEKLMKEKTNSRGQGYSNQTKTSTFQDVEVFFKELSKTVLFFKYKNICLENSLIIENLNAEQKRHLFFTAYQKFIQSSDSPSSLSALADVILKGKHINLGIYREILKSNRWPNPSTHSDDPLQKQ